MRSPERVGEEWEQHQRARNSNGALCLWAEKPASDPSFRYEEELPAAVILIIMHGIAASSREGGTGILDTTQGKENCLSLGGE